MIFTLTTFTIVHVLISLIGIGSGFIVLFGLLTGRRLNLGLFVALAIVTAIRFRIEPIRTTVRTT